MIHIHGYLLSYSGELTLESALSHHPLNLLPSSLPSPSSQGKCKSSPECRHTICGEQTQPRMCDYAGYCALPFPWRLESYKQMDWFQRNVALQRWWWSYCSISNISAGFYYHLYQHSDVQHFATVWYWYLHLWGHCCTRHVPSEKCDEWNKLKHYYNQSTW